MEPFRWLVSVIMVAFHDGLAALGMPAAEGWTWTLAIIGLVLVIRAALIPVFLAQVRAQRRMWQLQPDLKALQDKYRGKTDQLSLQAMAQEQMAAYKKHGINPFSACLPLLVQAPFFLALFQLLAGIADASARGEGIGAISHANAVQFASSAIFDAPLSASLLHGGGDPTTVAVRRRDDPGDDRLPVPHPAARAGPYHGRPGPGEPVPTPAEDPAVCPAGGVRRWRHHLPHRVLIYWTVSNLWTLVQQFLVTRNA